MEYPKIETLFVRDEVTHKVIVDQIRNPVWNIISEWQWTEKIDGTNVRIELMPNNEMYFKARTDIGQLPPKLFMYLQQTFHIDKLREVFWKTENEFFPITLYCEGYGAGIQKGGGNYNKSQVVRLYDVLVDNRWWLNWDNTCDVANKLGIKTVPFFGNATLQWAIDSIKKGFDSQVAIEEGVGGTKAEGMVGRTIEPLFDKKGHRLIIKLKTKDF